MRTALVTILVIVSTLFSACGTQDAGNEMQDKPFKGVWQIVNEPEFDAETGRAFGMYEMQLNIDFYEKSVDNGIEKTHGGFYVANDRGDGNCDIVSFKIDGNKAYIEYEDPSTIIFSATLVYSPSDKTMTFIDGDVVDMQEASQSMIAQFHYLQQESVLQPSKGNNNPNTIEEKKEPMGTFETILLLILNFRLCALCIAVRFHFWSYRADSRVFHFSTRHVFHCCCSCYCRRSYRTGHRHFRNQRMDFFPSCQQSSRRNGKKGKKQDICPRPIWKQERSKANWKRHIGRDLL